MTDFITGCITVLASRCYILSLNGLLTYGAHLPYSWSSFSCKWSRGSNEGLRWSNYLSFTITVLRLKPVDFFVKAFFMETLCCCCRWHRASQLSLKDATASRLGPVLIFLEQIAQMTGFKSIAQGHGLSSRFVKFQMNKMTSDYS